MKLYMYSLWSTKLQVQGDPNMFLYGSQYEVEEPVAGQAQVAIDFMIPAAYAHLYGNQHPVQEQVAGQAQGHPGHVHEVQAMNIDQVNKHELFVIE